jgi:trehalose/maltose hydrolase-like predicted phosphorylase
MATFSEERGRYEIHQVMGPDEFHEGYSDAPPAGVSNNAYTNIMAVWVLMTAFDVFERLPGIRRLELEARLGITAQETRHWEDVSRRMHLPFHDDGIISQFEGWSDLQELDWASYRTRYGNIQRLDLILESENDSANRYKVSKQPDVLLLFYLFSSEELRAIFERLGYPFEYETIPRSVAYYEQRSALGSTLSRVVNAWVLARSDRPRAMEYFSDALQSDVKDIQQGTTAEGIHLGAMAGTVDLIQRVAFGLVMTGDALVINPRLPSELTRLDLRIHYRGHWLDLRLSADELIIHCHGGMGGPVTLVVGEERFDFPVGSARAFQLGPGAPVAIPDRRF